MSDSKPKKSIVTTLAVVAIAAAGVLLLRDIVFTDSLPEPNGKGGPAAVVPIVIEAERFVARDRDENHPEGFSIVVIPDPHNAFGDGYIEIPEGVGKPGYMGRPADWGWAEYVFDAPAEGDYVIYARTWWDDSCGNTVRLRFNDDERAVYTVTDNVYRQWHWVRAPRTVRLHAGENRMRLINNEDGVRIDCIHLVPAGTAYTPPERDPDA